MTARLIKPMKGKTHWCCRLQQSPVQNVRLHFLTSNLPLQSYIISGHNPPITTIPVSHESWAKLPAKAMELQGAIEPGSMAKLRQQAKDAQNHSLKSVQMLSNAMSPVVNIDQFLPRPGTPGGTSDKDALTKKPVLIACADEERKQQLVPHELSLPAINIILTFTFLFYIYISKSLQVSEL